MSTPRQDARGEVIYDILDDMEDQAKLDNNSDAEVLL